MRVLLTTSAILFFACSAIAQLPDHGNIDEIKGKTRFYLLSPAKERKYILKELTKKQLVEVRRAEDADFIVEYVTLNNKEKQDLPSLTSTSITGQMDVYYFNGDRRVIVWSEGKTASWSTAAYLALPRKFVKELLKQ